MKVLLDTHSFLWFALDDPRLSAIARSHIEDPSNVKFISPATYWEIAIKMSVGKYSLTVPHDVFFESTIADNGFHVLNIEPRQTAALVTLPFHHRDPFDRLLVAQAIVESMPPSVLIPGSTPIPFVASGDKIAIPFRLFRSDTHPFLSNQSDSPHQFDTPAKSVLRIPQVDSLQAFAFGSCRDRLSLPTTPG